MAPPRRQEGITPYTRLEIRSLARSETCRQSASLKLKFPARTRDRISASSPPIYIPRTI